MTTREKVLLTLMGVACTGTALNFALSDLFVSHEEENTAALQHVRSLASETAVSLQSLPLKEHQRYILATAQLPITRTPFALPEPQTASPTATEASVGQGQLVYSGYVLVGKEAFAIINGLEYTAGETLPGSGDHIRTIRHDGIVLYSPSRDLEWVLPYSGDDL